MKRLFILFVTILCASLCFAQDVIVKKDGSTILARVLEVTQTSVSYKTYDNQDGPTCKIGVSELQTINYQNGSKTNFADFDPQENGSVSDSYSEMQVVSEEKVVQHPNDQQLLQLYDVAVRDGKMRKAKTLKMVGWIGAPVIALTLFCVLQEFVGSEEFEEVAISASIGLAAGAAWGFGFNCASNKIRKRYQNVVFATPLFQHEISFSKDKRLLVSTDVLNGNTSGNHFFKSQTLGIGLRYNF